MHALLSRAGVVQDASAGGQLLPERTAEAAVHSPAAQDAVSAGYTVDERHLHDEPAHEDRQVAGSPGQIVLSQAGWRVEQPVPGAAQMYP